MSENILFLEPNLSIFLQDGEFKHYNLVSGRNSDFGNMLLVKTSDGNFIPPIYPTTVELQNPITSLDHDGEYFWSIHKINNTPYYPGWVLNKWIISDEQYSLSRQKFKLNPGFSGPSCLTIEHYKMVLKEGTDPSKDYIKIDTSYGYVLERLAPGRALKVGPNSRGEVFWGSIQSVYPYPNNPYQDPYYWVIEFDSYLNSSYVAGEDLFVEINIFVFDAGGNLHRIDPVSLAIEETTYKSYYKNVSSCAFSVVKYVPNINVSMQTSCLFFIIDMVIYCVSVDNLDHILSAQTIPLNHKSDGNDFIEVKELRVRNDDFTSINNYPQHYLLQQESRVNYDDGLDHYSTYNYQLQKLHAEPAHMVVNISPQAVAQSGTAYCSCRILDTYRLPVSDVDVVWSHNCGLKAYFLDTVSGTTDSEGYIHNRLYALQTLDFPVEVTVYTEAL